MKNKSRNLTYLYNISVDRIDSSGITRSKYSHEDFLTSHVAIAIWENGFDLKGSSDSETIDIFFEDGAFEVVRKYSQNPYFAWNLIKESIVCSSPDTTILNNRREKITKRGVVDAIKTIKILMSRLAGRYPETKPSVLEYIESTSKEKIIFLTANGIILSGANDCDEPQLNKIWTFGNEV